MKTFTDLFKIFIPVNIRRGISNLVKWVPIIWGDRVFDSMFLFTILYYKLSDLKFFLKSNNTVSEGTALYAKEINVALKLLNRIIKDEWYDNVTYNGFNAKWGKRTSSIGDDGLYNIKYENVITHVDEIAVAKDIKECAIRVAELRQSDKDRFFNFLSKNIDNWWD